MRIRSGLGVVMALVVGALWIGVGVEVGAFQATPAASPIPGYTTELLGLASSSSAPGQALQLIRVTFEPGVRTTPHARSGERINYVFAGTYVFKPLSGGIEAKRLATGGATGPAERLTPGVEHTFTAGDIIVLREDAVYESRNPGPGQLVILVAALSPADELTTTYIAATPSTGP